MLSSDFLSDNNGIPYLTLNEHPSIQETMLFHNIQVPLKFFIFLKIYNQVIYKCMDKMDLFK